MILLKIREVGLVINIPPLPETKTPAEIDISRVGVNKVVLYLKKNGIDKYEIVGNDTPIPKQIKPIEKPEPQIKVIHDEKMDDRLNNIEYLLKQILTQNKDFNIQSISQLVNSVSKPVGEDIVLDSDDDDDDFIPSLDMSSLKISNSKDHIQKLKSKTDKKDTDEKVNLLSRIVRKKR